MNRLADNTVCNSGIPRQREQANTRTVILLVIVFLAGMALSGLWFYPGRPHGPAKPESQADAKAGATALTSGTQEVLKRLDAPIEIRFYSILDPASALDPLRAFAGRVDQLLAQYQQEAPGKIKTTRFDSQSYSNANAAASDGIKPFNTDKGDACYLGIALVCKGRKESLSSLSPEWEQALEPDLTRAIARVEEIPSQAQLTAAPAQSDPEALEAVRRAIPNIDSVSLQEGTQILQEATLNEFARVAQEMEAKVKEAEQNFLQAQTNQSEAGQQNARKELQQLQAEQTDKLKQVVAKSQAQLQALQQLKAK